jgi:[acyl-carrier-protein] S-malonyltransferase
MKYALLFPGQGAQYVGMGKTLIETFPLARSLFEEASDLLGIPLIRYCLEGPEDILNQTDTCQPAIYVQSVALLKILEAEKGLPPATAVAGLSLGEYSALYAAGVFSFQAGLALVQKRGRYMQEACEIEPSGMATILGLTEEELAPVVAEVQKSEGTLQQANFLAERQIALSGRLQAVQIACEKAKAMGAKIFPLKVAGAFHSPLMKPARERLAQALQNTPLQPAKIPVLSNVTAYPLTDPLEIRQRLIEQLTEPVRWFQSLQYLLSQNFSTFIEIGPGNVLTGILKRIARQTRRENLDDALSVQTWLSSLST